MTDADGEVAMACLAEWLQDRASDPLAQGLYL
jgi:hypothetical protein